MIGFLRDLADDLATSLARQIPGVRRAEARAYERGWIAGKGRWNPASSPTRWNRWRRGR